MQNKRLFIIAILVLITLLLVVFGFAVVRLISGDGAEGQGDSVVFPESEEVNQDLLREANFLFGTSSERYVMEGNGTRPAPDFRALTTEPSVGIVVTERDTTLGSSTPFVRYVNQENGHVYELPLSVVGNEKELTKKTVLRVAAASLSQSGSSTLLQYHSDIGDVHTYLGTLQQPAPTSSEPGVYLLDGTTLANNITSTAFSPSGEHVLYVQRGQDGATIYKESLMTGDKIVLWSSLLRNVHVAWPHEASVLVYTNPTSIAEGLVFTLNPDTGVDQVVLGGEFALAGKQDPTAQRLLYSLQEQVGGVVSLRVLEQETGKTTYLEPATVVEKCVWGPSGSVYIYCAVPREPIVGTMLEDWYMGKVHTDDVIWRFNTFTGGATMLLDPLTEVEQRFDIVDLVVSPSEEYLVLRTKVNNVLWSLRLPEDTQPAAGSGEVTDEAG